MGSKFEMKPELMNERARVYGFLSRIFREELDKVFLGHMKKGLRQLDSGSVELVQSYHRLKKFLDPIKIDDELMEDLASDYADLFLAVGQNPAHPYESVYIGGDGILMGEPRNEVITLFRREMIRRVEWFKEPEDHVAIELEFMAYLCIKANANFGKKCSAGWEQGIRLQLAFLEQHLIKWLPAFCADILKCPLKRDFYHIIAQFTEAYMFFDQEALRNCVPGASLGHQAEEKLP